MIRRVFLLFMSFGLVACSGGTGPEDIVGTYTLETVDGEELPVVVEEIETYIFELTAGSMTLSGDTSCSLSLTQRLTEDGTVTTGTNTIVCTYVFDDGALTLTLPPENSTISGSIADSTVTLMADAGVLTFRR